VTCRSPAPGTSRTRCVRPCSVRPMPSPQDITKTVNRYLELVASGRANDHQAIRGFYASIENVKARTEMETQL
jgi:hypothetical protein